MADPRFRTSPPGTLPLPGLAPAGRPARPPARKTSPFVVTVAAVTAVLSVTAFLAVFLWPAGGEGSQPDALAFQPFQEVAQVQFDRATGPAFTRLDGHRVLVAWEQSGDLQLRAVSSTTGREEWQVEVTGSPGWEDVFPMPDAVAVVGAGQDGPERIYVRSAVDGQPLWEEAVHFEDILAGISDDVLVWFQISRQQVRGVNIRTGAVVWTYRLPQRFGAVWVTSDDDLAQTTDAQGRITVSRAVEYPTVGERADARMVVVDGDRGATVLDTRNGTVLQEGVAIADPDDDFIAHQGRLYVAPDERGYQLESYDLANLSAVPQIHYRAGPEQEAQEIAVCGIGKVCLLETERFRRETTELVVVDVTDSSSGTLRLPVPDVDSVLSVGSWVLAVGADGPVVGFDEHGQQVLDRPGVPARLNSGNMLVFATVPGAGTADLSVVGVPTGGGQVIELGQLPGVTGEQCLWNETHIACPDRDGARIWKFADV